MNAATEEAHRRLETLKEDHKQQMFEETDDYELLGGGKAEDAIGIATNNRHRLIAEVIEEVQQFFPEPEPEVVTRYRSLIYALDTMNDVETDRFITGGGLHALERQAIEYHGKALDAITERIEIQEPSDEDDADVLYLFDPVSKLTTVTATGGYSPAHDQSMLEDDIRYFAESILNDALPDTMPRV